MEIFLVVIFAVVITLLLFQDKMIYHPRPYAEDPARYPGIVTVEYQTGQGRQQAYYMAPAIAPLTHAPLPHRLWVVFPGNASRALDWVDFLDPRQNAGDGFLLIDYPGYGACQGKPSRDAIKESSEAAFRALAETLKVQPAALDENLAVLCQSIGCATGLNFAVNHPVKRVILLAPFTTLREMARRTVGWPLCLLLRHNYDNCARLGELAASAKPPRVTILHGDADSLVPIAMGRELAAKYPTMIQFEAVPGAGHNTIMTEGQGKILAAMRE